MSLAPSRTRKNCRTKERQHQHHHGRHEQRDGHDTDGEQRASAINESRHDYHAGGNGYLARRGPDKQAGVVTQHDMGTATSSPTCAIVDAAHDGITKHVPPQACNLHCCGVRGRSPPSSSGGPSRIPKLPRTSHRTSAASARRQGMQRRQGTRAPRWWKRRPW